MCQTSVVVEPYELNVDQVAQIERAKREWEVTVDSLPQLICLLDQRRRIIRANRTVERWHLGEVTRVKGQEIHNFLHPDCTDPDCYLADFLEQAWAGLAQNQPTQCEAKDEVLMRHLQVQVQPISKPKMGNDKAAVSYVVLVLEDITEQRQTEAALRQYARELAARNQDLDAFAHTVAHNLKGLLAPIIGYAELLRNVYQTASVAAIRRDLGTIAQSGHKMNRIIDELLMLANVRKTEVQRRPLNMATIINEVKVRLAHMIEEYEAELILPASWPQASGYGPWVEEIWANYLSNAIKYGGRPPRLELGATVLEGAEGMVRFWVRDNGPGLKPEEQARLFAPFTQLHQVRTGGHGLGLSIVRRIVEKLGGCVGVESEGIPGRGCVFSFTLPGPATEANRHPLAESRHRFDR